MPKTQPSLIVWAALLMRCERNILDINDGDDEAKDCAQRMYKAGVLNLTGEPHEYILTSKGMTLLTALERLRDFSLGE